MAFPHASFETYTALRDMDTSHPNITPPDEGGRWRLCQMASWGRWGAATGDLAPITAHSSESFDQLEPFTTSVVLFGINLGGDRIATALEDWRNFHTVSHAGDAKLKESLRMAKIETPEWHRIPAFYMSDVFKLIPTKDGVKLGEQITADLDKGIDHVDRCAAILREELKICMDGAGGQAPTLVAMGGFAFKWLSGAEKDKRIANVVDEVLGDGARKRVLLISHGTSSTDYPDRVAALTSILKDIIDGAQDRAPEPAAVS